MTENINEKINQQDWGSLTERLNNKGYIVLKDFFSESQCQQMIFQYNDPKSFRKTVNMERFRFGKGEFKYFAPRREDSNRVSR